MQPSSPAPQVVSVNVGEPREVVWQGRRVLTGIYKFPVTGPVVLRYDNFVGDRQADLTVHGGPDKAVYVYPADYYPLWHRELPDMELPWGMFGENLTVAGLDDASVCIGDRYRVGTAELIVTQPRMPCYKLGIKFGRASFLKQFLKSRRTGFYFAIVQEGSIATGDTLQLVAREPEGIAVADIVRLYVQDCADVAGLRRAVATQALPEGWRAEFQERLDGIG